MMLIVLEYYSMGDRVGLIHINVHSECPYVNDKNGDPSPGGKIPIENEICLNGFTSVG